MNRAFALLMLIVASGFAIASDTMAVGELHASRGERVSGYLEIDAASDGGTQIPVSIIHGAQDGPVLALIAGTHGYEYPGITALQRVLQNVDPQSLRGTLLLVHIANPPSFYGRTIYYSPADGKNLNRVFPGDPNGSLSERIAYAITVEVIERADFLIDLHAGDGNEALRPYVYMPVTGDEALDRQTRHLAVYFGLDHIVIDERPLGTPDASVYTDQTGLTRGIPSITTETGQLGSNDDHWVTLAENGVFNVMRSLEMYPGETMQNDGVVWLADYEVIRTEQPGLFVATVRDGYAVSAGTLLGFLTDAFGSRIAEFRSPFAGVVNYVLGTPPVNAGEPVAMVSKLAQ